MKFGSQLKDAIYPEWTPFYIDYDGLKKKLRKAEKDRPFTEKDETEFVELLDNNLEKVVSGRGVCVYKVKLNSPLAGVRLSPRENRGNQKEY